MRPAASGLTISCSICYWHGIPEPIEKEGLGDVHRNRLGGLSLSLALYKLPDSLSLKAIPTIYSSPALLAGAGAGAGDRSSRNGESLTKGIHTEPDPPTYAQSDTPPLETEEPREA